MYDVFVGLSLRISTKQATKYIDVYIYIYTSVLTVIVSLVINHHHEPTSTGAISMLRLAVHGLQCQQHAEHLRSYVPWQSRNCVRAHRGRRVTGSPCRKMLEKEGIIILKAIQ